jgi:hypothetical protein
MKTAAINQETINLDRLEKTTNQILKKISDIRPIFFSNKLKFSKKAEEEKLLLFKSLFPEKILGINKTQEDFIKIVDDANFSKLEKVDQDFILGLDKIGFKNSQYVSELNDLAKKEKHIDDAFFNFFIGENIYFNFLSSELRTIRYKLDNFRLNP